MARFKFEENILCTANSSLDLVETMKTDLPAVPSLGFTTSPSGYFSRRRSIPSHDPDEGIYSFRCGPKNNVCGMQGTPEISSTSAVAALSLAIRCAMALFRPISYPNAKCCLDPRRITMSQP